MATIFIEGTTKITVETNTILEEKKYNYPNEIGRLLPRTRNVFHYYVFSQGNGQEDYNPDRDFGTFDGISYHHFKMNTNRGIVFLHKFSSYSLNSLSNFVKSEVERLFSNNPVLTLLDEPRLKIKLKPQQEPCFRCGFKFFFSEAEYLD